MKTTNLKRLSPLPLAALAGTLFLTVSPLHAASTDDRIESAAAKSYVFKTTLKDDDIKTEAKDGVVTLTGTVADADHKSLAQDTVASLPGVTSVNNELVVSGDQPPEYSDTWITTKVKTTLLFHRHVSATATTVTTRDGVVILTGVADNRAQKELTTEYAKGIDHVKAVVNDMTIAATPAAADSSTGDSTSDSIDDASITAEVKDTLMAHRATSAMHTGVSTTNGVVTLTGVAENPAEVSLVTKLVSDVKGVTSVVNNMTTEVAKSDL